jgi:hypothetical protein
MIRPKRVAGGGGRGRVARNEAATEHWWPAAVPACCPAANGLLLQRVGNPLIKIGRVGIGRGVPHD